MCGFQEVLCRFICIFFLRAAGEVCMFICTKKKAKCICLRMQNLKWYAYLNVYTKKLPAGCRQQRCICLYAYIFSPHANSSGQTSGQKVKKCIHYIYAKYPFFIFKKCIHYIYARNHISSRQQSFHRPHHYSSIPKTSRQQAKTDQTTTLSPHILQAYTTQQGQAITTQPLQYSKKRYTLTPAAGIHTFFRPLFPLSSKRQTENIFTTEEQKG